MKKEKRMHPYQSAVLRSRLMNKVGNDKYQEKVKLRYVQVLIMWKKVEKHEREREIWTMDGGGEGELMANV